MPRMRILAGTALTLALVALPALVLAQTANLSGTWKMNSNKSVLPQASQGGGGGGRGGRAPGGTGGGMFPQQMIIKHEGTKVEMTWTQPASGRQASAQTITRTFTTDGKPTDNDQGGNKVVVKAVWKNNMLMVDEISELTMPDGQTRSMTTSYSLTLSPDGKSLLRYQEMGRGDQIMSANVVYDKIK
jgi:hypothetical protein